MKTLYDRVADAAYFSFSNAGSARMEKLDELRVVDYDANGSVVGVEILFPSRGTNVTGLPHAPEIERELRRLGLPVLHPAG